MSYSALINTPIQVNLVQAAKDTGWSVSDGLAVHESCNSGSITLTSYPVKAGQTYEVSYAILSISGGYVAMNAGGTTGTHHISAAPIVETITAAADGFISFFSDANCTIEAFNIRNTFQSTSNTQQNTIVYSYRTKKWSEFRTIAPDYGFSIDIYMVTIYQGALWLHLNGSDSRNSFYGVQYQSILQWVENKASEGLKSYNSIAMQSNQLLVTEPGGITTDLGQVSELIAEDFVKSVLTDGVSTQTVYDLLGIYSASFLNDINSDGGIINGDQLSGSYIIISLITVNGDKPLKLFSIAVNASAKHIGVR